MSAHRSFFHLLFKRKWHFFVTAVLILCIGGITFFLKPRTKPQEPIKVYKAVTSDPKSKPITSNKEETDITTFHHQGHSHTHSDETEPHSHTTESNVGSAAYDWRDDGVFESPPPKEDPWEPTYPEQQTTDANDTYPPRDWYKTKDPELRAEYLYAQLIKQFGDTPEVQTIGDYELKVARGIAPTLEEYANYLEAHYTLFPNEDNRRTLEDFRKIVASGSEIIFE